MPYCKQKSLSPPKKDTNTKKGNKQALYLSHL